MRISVLLQFTKKMLSAFQKIEFFFFSVPHVGLLYFLTSSLCLTVSSKSLLAQEPSQECFGILYFLAVHKKCLEIICQKFVHNFHANLLLALFDRSRRRRVVDVEKVFEM